MTKWTEETTLKFVQEYLQHPVLYNCKDPNYKNKGARDAALNQISQNMKISGMGSKEVYSKIRSLKSTYSQEAKRVKQSYRSGAGAADIYAPQIKWFKLWNDTMNAINIQYRDSQSNMEAEAGHEDTLAEENVPDMNVPNTPEPETQQNKSPLPKKRSIRDLSRLVNKVKSVADTLYTPLAASQSGGEFDIFGKSVAAQLNSMPLSVAIQGQMFIQNYLCSLRLQAMGHGTSLSPSPSPQSLPTTPLLHPPPSNSLSPQLSPSFIFPPQSSPQPLPSTTYIPARQTTPSPHPLPSTTLSPQPLPTPSFIFPPQSSPQPLPSTTYIPARQTISSPHPPPSTTLSSQPLLTPSFIFPSETLPQFSPSMSYVPATHTSHSPPSTNILHADQSGNQNTQIVFFNDNDDDDVTITITYSDNQESETQNDILALAVASISK